MADRVLTKEELRQLLESGQLSVTDLGPQTKAVYDSMLAEGQRPKATVASAVEDPYQAVADAAAGPMEMIGDFFRGETDY